VSGRRAVSQLTIATVPTDGLPVPSITFFNTSVCFIKRVIRIRKQGDDPVDPSANDGRNGRHPCDANQQ
jgi:hypothetical protein